MPYANIWSRTGNIYVFIGVLMYWFGRSSHRHNGKSYRLFTAPGWLSAVCGIPLPDNRLSRLPAAFQIVGLLFILTKPISMELAASTVRFLILFGLPVAAMALSNAVIDALGNSKLMGADDWFRELMEKQRGTEVINRQGTIAVESEITLGKPGGYALIGVSVFIATQLNGRPGLVDVFCSMALLVLGIYLVNARIERWECYSDSIVHWGYHGKKSVIQWSEITSARLLDEDVELIAPSCRTVVPASGRGLPGFFMLMKTKIEPHRLSNRLNEIMAVVPDLALTQQPAARVE